MRIYPSSRSRPAPAIARVQRSRPYADYRLLDEHDPLVHSGADEWQRRAAAADAAQAIASLMQRLAGLKSVMEQGSTAFRRYEVQPEADDGLVSELLDKLNACLRLFDEHPALRQSWRHSLCEPLLLPRMQQSGIACNSSAFEYAEAGADRPPRPNDRLTKRKPETANGMTAIFGLHGAAAALRLVIDRMERSPASALLGPDALAQLNDPLGVVYSPFIRMHALKRANLLLSLKG